MVDLPKIPLDVVLEGSNKRLEHLIRLEDGVLPICIPHVYRIKRQFWREEKLIGVHAKAKGTWTVERIN